MDYLGTIRAYIYTTEQLFVLDEFGERSIKQRSRFYEQQLANTAPTYLAGYVTKSTLQDESSYLQYGQATDYEFYSYNLPPPKPSSWSDYPTRENPLGIFKYGSMEIGLSQDLTSWNRQTYSILDFIGDLGGLLDGLKYACLLVLAPFSTFNL